MTCCYELINGTIVNWLCMFCVEIGLDDHSHVYIIANFGCLLVEGLRISFDNVVRCRLSALWI